MPVVLAGGDLLGKAMISCAHSRWRRHSLKGGKNLANPVRGTPARTQPPEPEIVAFHNKTYGPDFTYPEFAPRAIPPASNRYYA